MRNPWLDFACVQCARKSVSVPGDSADGLAAFRPRPCTCSVSVQDLVVTDIHYPNCSGEIAAPPVDLVTIRDRY
jgi:hypothetical protein